MGKQYCMGIYLFTCFCRLRTTYMDRYFQHFPCGGIGGIHMGILGEQNRNSKAYTASQCHMYVYLQHSFLVLFGSYNTSDNYRINSHILCKTFYQKANNSNGGKEL